MEQLPLPLRHPKRQPPPPVPLPPPPKPWSVAVAALWKLPKSLLRLIHPELPLPIRRKPQNRIKYHIDPATLPYAVKPSTVIWMIQTAPPPKPLCFDSQKQWQEYLMYLHADGTPITRRQDTGKWKTVNGQKVRVARTVTRVFDRIDFCDGCTAERREQMQDEKRCIVPRVP